jgi:hypothetical protein
MTPHARALLIAVTALALAGCSSEKPGTVVARVGDSVLTLEDAALVVDTASPGGPGRLARYAASWVNAELLYQEALRQGIGGDAAFGARIEAMRRQLASQELLDRVIYGDTAAVPDSALRAYFTSHPDEFTLSENHLKLRLATFRNRETARRFTAAVTAGATWDGLIDSMAADPKSSAEIVSATQEAWYTRATIYPQELWKVAGPLNPGDVSFPLKTGEGYTVVQYLALAAAGRTDEFDVVRDEVTDRVLVEQRRSKLESLLGTLRDRYGVEILIKDGTRPEGTPKANE